jgi:hypothetical protein
MTNSGNVCVIAPLLVCPEHGRMRHHIASGADARTALIFCTEPDGEPGSCGYSVPVMSALWRYAASEAE